MPSMFRVLRSLMLSLLLGATGLWLIPSASAATVYYHKQLVPGLCKTCTNASATLKPVSSGQTAGWTSLSSGSNLLFSSTSLSFADTAVGETSIEEDFNISTLNSSTTPRILSATLDAGDNNFTVSNNCPSSGIAPGTYCTIAVRFTPQDLGAPLTGTITLTTDDPANPVALSVSGNSYNRIPDWKLLTASPGFAPTAVGTSSTEDLQIQNTGDGILEVTSATLTGANATDFSIVSNTCGKVSYLAGYNTCDIVVQFTPTLQATENVTLNLQSNAASNNGQMTIAMSGIGFVPAPQFTPPSSINVGNYSVGTSASNYTVTFTNTASGYAAGNLLISNLSIASAQGVSIGSSNCATVAPGASCQIVLAVNTASAGAISGNLTFTANTPTASYSIPISGSVTQPGTYLQSSGGTTLSSSSVIPHDFGQVDINTTSTTWNYVMTNYGSSAITGFAVSMSGTGFKESNNCGSTINSLASCTITFTAAPTANTSYSATATLSGTGVSGAQFQLSEQGVTRTYAVSPTSLSFGYVSVGYGSPSLNVTVTNTGSINLQPTFTFTSQSNLSGVTATACPSVAPGQSCTTHVSVTPTAVGGFSAQMQIGGAASTYTVGISGTGSSVQAVLDTTSYDFGLSDTNQTTGGKVFTLYNKGSSSFSIAGVSVPSYFTATSNTCSGSVAAGSSCQVTVAFAAPWLNMTDAAYTSSVTLTGTLSISVSGLSQPYTAALSGEVKPSKVDLAPVSLNFGSMYAYTGTSAPQTITLTNNGAGTAQISSIYSLGGQTGYTANVSIGSYFHFDNTPAGSCVLGNTLAPGASCTLTFTFSPGWSYSDVTESYAYANWVVGFSTASLPGSTWQTSTPIPSGSSLVSLTAVDLQPTLQLTPSSLTYSNVPEGTKATQTVTLTAVNGGVYANYSGLGPSSSGTNGSVFSVITNTCPANGSVLAVGTSCQWTVQFAPPPSASTASTSWRASLTAYLESSFAKMPTPSVALSGTSLRGALTYASTTDAGTAPEDLYGPYTTVQVTNSGQGNVAIQGASLNSQEPAGTWSGSYYPFSGNGVNGGALKTQSGQTNCWSQPTLAPGQSCYYEFQAYGTDSPTTALTGTLVFNTSLGQQQAALTATMQPTTLSVSPTAIDLGNYQTQTTVTLPTITVTNNGVGQARLLSSPWPPGYYQSGGTCVLDDRTGTMLAAGQSCTLILNYSTGGAAAINDTLNLKTSQSGATTFPVTVTATRLYPTLSLSSPTMDFGNVQTGTSPSQTVTLSNTGTGTLNLSQLGLYTSPASYVYLNGSATPVKVESSSNWHLVQNATSTSLFNNSANGYTTTCGASLAAGASCTITVQWNASFDENMAPTKPQAFDTAASLYFVANTGGANTSEDVVLTGISSGADFTLSPETQTLGSMEAATDTSNPDVKFTLTATGSSNVVIRSLNNLPGFSYDTAQSTCLTNTVVTPGQTCTIAYQDQLGGYGNYLNNYPNSGYTAPWNASNNYALVVTNGTQHESSGTTVEGNAVVPNFTGTLVKPLYVTGLNAYSLPSTGGTLEAVLPSGDGYYGSFRTGVTMTLGANWTSTSSQVIDAAHAYFTFGPRSDLAGQRLSASFRNHDGLTATYASGLQASVMNSSSDSTQPVYTWLQGSAGSGSTGPVSNVPMQVAYDTNGNKYVFDGTTVFKYDVNKNLVASSAPVASGTFVYGIAASPQLVVNPLNGDIWLATASEAYNANGYYYLSVSATQLVQSGNSLAIGTKTGAGNILSRWYSSGSLNLFHAAFSNGRIFFLYADSAISATYAITLDTSTLTFDAAGTSVASVDFASQTSQHYLAGNLHGVMVFKSGLSDYRLALSSSSGLPILIALDSQSSAGSSVTSMALDVDDSTLWGMCGTAICVSRDSSGSYSPWTVYTGNPSQVGYVDGALSTALFDPNNGLNALTAAPEGLYVGDMNYPAIRGINITQPRVVVDKPSLSFVYTQVGSSQPAQTVTVFNTTGNTVSFGTPSASVSDYQVSSNCSSLANGQSCTLSVTFAPVETLGASQAAQSVTLPTSLGNVVIAVSGQSGTYASYASCQDVLNHGASTGDGIYYLTPAGQSNPVPVYCDMTDNGGGWTLAVYSSNNLPNAVLWSSLGIKGGSLSTYSQLPGTYPALPTATPNSYSQILYKTSNSTWNNRIGGACLSFNMFPAGTTSIGSSAGFPATVCGSGATFTLFQGEAGWYAAGSPSDSFELFDTWGPSGICGGSGTPGGKNCLNLNPSGYTYSYHWDGVNDKFVFVR